MAVLATPFFLQFLDDNGNPVVNGKVYTYAAGTTTPKATYTDFSETVQAANPVILDAAGRATMWISGSYKYVLTDANDVVIRTTDNVTAFTIPDSAGNSFFQSFNGDGATTAFVLSQALGTDEKALLLFTTVAGAWKPLLPTDFTVNGTALSITVAPEVGVDNIRLWAPSLLVAAAAASAAAAAASETNAAASATLAAKWATWLTNTVDGSEYSAKTYAVGGNAGYTLGSAKDWATQLTTAVSGGLFSARQYALNAAAQVPLAAGAASWLFNYSTNTGATDPGSGGVKFNSATFSSATQMYISETTSLSQAIAAELATWDDSTSTIRGKLRVYLSSDPTNFVIFSVTGTLTDSGTWDTFTVAYVTGAGSIPNGSAVAIQYIRNGDKGDAGAAGAPGAPGTVSYTVATGTANAQVIAPTTPLGAYAAGDTRWFVPVASNTAAAVTINVSGLGTRNIKKFIGGAVVNLAVNDLIINQPALLVDDGTQYILVNYQTYTQGADIASAATLNLDQMTGDYLNVTGTTNVTAITLAQGRQVTIKMAGILTLTNGASLILSGGANITTAAGDCFTFRGEAGGVVRMVGYALASGAAIVGSTGLAPTYHISGLLPASFAVNPNQGVNISVGACWDSTGTTFMALSSPLVKLINSAWAAGSGNGAMDTGSVASVNTYYLFLISNAAGTLVDALWSLSPTAPTMPVGYTKFRRIYAQVYNTSGFSLMDRRELRNGAVISWVDVVSIAVSTAGTLGTTATAIALSSNFFPAASIPFFGAIVEATFSNVTVGTTAAMTGGVETAPVAGTAAGQICSALVAVTGRAVAYTAEVLLNAANQVTIVASAASTTYTIKGLASVDYRNTFI